MKVPKRWLALVALLFAITACSPAPANEPAGTGSAQNAGSTTQTETPKKGGVLKVGVQNFDAALDPLQSRTGYSQHVMFTVFERLVDLDPIANVTPGLATKWDVGSDAKSITLTLREGVKFHDGEPFNAAAAKIDLDRARDPKTSRWAGLFTSIESVEAPNPTTLRINLSQPDVSVLTNLAHHGMYITSPKATTTGPDGKIVFKPIGTGPFKVEGETSTDRINVVRNPEYWQADKVHLDRIEFYRIPDVTVRTAGLRSGDLDIIDAPAAQDLAGLKSDPTFGYIEKPGVIGYITRFIISKPPFDNVHLRRAVGYAIDREAIFKVALLGTGTAHSNFMYPAHWGFDPNFKGLQLDLNKAKQELQAGGQPNGFSFQMTVANREPELTMAQAMKAQLVKANIDMEIISEDSTAGFDNFRAGKYPARMSGGSRGAEPITDIDEFRSDSPDNYFGYKDAEFDKQFVIVRSSFDVKQRAAAMYKINQILFVDDPVGVMLGDAVDAKVFNAKLRGIAPAYGYPMRVAFVWWGDTPKPGPVSNK